MFAGDTDSVYDPRGSIYALEVATPSSHSAFYNSRAGFSRSAPNTPAQPQSQHSNLPLSDPRHPANNPLHPSLSTRRKNRLLNPPASRYDRRESSGSTLTASFDAEEERLEQERREREKEARVRSMWRNERDFGWSDSAGGVRSGREGIKEERGREGAAEGGGLRRWMSVGGGERKNATRKPYSPVFAPSATLEEVQDITEVPPTIPYNAGSRELALGSGLGRKQSLSKRIGGALSRGLGSLRRNPSTERSRRQEAELGAVQEENQKEGEEEDVEEDKLARHLSRRATTGGGRGRRAGIPAGTQRTTNQVTNQSTGSLTTDGQPRERLSKAWQNIELPEIPLYKPPAAANVPNARALSSFAPRPPLRARSNTTHGSANANTPAAMEKQKYEEREKRSSVKRSGWTQFNNDE